MALPRHCPQANLSQQDKSKGDPLEFDKKKYKNVTHCIFDMDGTVLDSEVMYHKMVTKICDKYSKVYSKDLQIRMYGVTDREICVTVVKELKLPISADEFELQLTDLTAKMLPSAPLQKGAERVLTHLHDHKIPMALATNSTEQAVRLHATARPKLFGMFHHKVSVTDQDVDRGKPHPDIFLVAAARFPMKPKAIQVVMIPDLRLDREMTRHATLVIRSLMDFKPEMFGLPPFPDMPKDIKQKATKILEDDPHDVTDNTEQVKKNKNKSLPPAPV